MGVGFDAGIIRARVEERSGDVRARERAGVDGEVDQEAPGGEGVDFLVERVSDREKFGGLRARRAWLRADCEHNEQEQHAEADRAHGRASYARGAGRSNRDTVCRLARDAANPPGGVDGRPQGVPGASLAGPSSTTFGPLTS